MRTVLVAGAALFCFASVALAEAVNICGVGPSGEICGVSPSGEANNTPGANGAAADSAQTCTCTNVKITGKATEDCDEAEDRAELSGVVVDKDKTRLIAIANEGFGPGKRDHALQIFEGDLAQGYVFKKDITLFEVPNNFCNEADFEGLTTRDGDLFAITSHSRDRKKQADDSSYDENRKRLTAKGFSGCPWRYQLKQFRLNDSDKVSVVKEVNLLAMIVSDPVLAPFVALPNKENGIDIEGLAVEVSIAPKVAFESGKAVSATLNWGEAEAPMLAYALIYAGTGLDNSANVLGPEVTRMVNEFTTKKCAKLKDDLPSTTAN